MALLLQVRRCQQVLQCCSSVAWQSSEGLGSLGRLPGAALCQWQVAMYTVQCVGLRWISVSLSLSLSEIWPWAHQLSPAISMPAATRVRPSAGSTWPGSSGCSPLMMRRYWSRDASLHNVQYYKEVLIKHMYASLHVASTVNSKAWYYNLFFSNAIVCS